MPTLTFRASATCGICKDFLHIYFWWSLVASKLISDLFTNGPTSIWFASHLFLEVSDRPEIKLISDLFTNSPTSILSYTQSYRIFNDWFLFVCKLNRLIATIMRFFSFTFTKCPYYIAPKMCYFYYRWRFSTECNKICYQTQIAVQNFSSQFVFTEWRHQGNILRFMDSVYDNITLRSNIIFSRHPLNLAIFI